METLNVPAKHVVIIPSFNTGPILIETVQDALKYFSPVWVLIDGSTDGSEKPVEELARANSGLRVIKHDRNRGKGAAVLTASKEALAAGFDHALVMDADGQHPADRIPDFIRASRENPGTLILGRPVFGPEAPQIRLQGRKLSIWLVRFEIMGSGIDDPLFGFRVYPLAALVRVFDSIGGGRHYDFDPEIAVRMYWNGTPTLNIDAACRYRSESEGGVSHFHYLRDNLRMTWLHTKLITELIFRRWPAVRRLRTVEPHSA